MFTDGLAEIVCKAAVATCAADGQLWPKSSPEKGCPKLIAYICSGILRCA